MATEGFGDIDEIRILNLDKADHTILSFSGVDKCYIKKEEDKRILICEPPKEEKD